MSDPVERVFWATRDFDSKIVNIWNRPPIFNQEIGWTAASDIAGSRIKTLATSVCAREWNEMTSIILEGGPNSMAKFKVTKF